MCEVRIECSSYIHKMLLCRNEDISSLTKNRAGFDFTAERKLKKISHLWEAVGHRLISSNLQVIKVFALVRPLVKCSMVRLTFFSDKDSGTRRN